jgi:Mn-dependent DtxR family transcriptional regulator
MPGWSMKKDRELIELARTNPSVERIAARLDMSPKSVIKAAKRLGIKIGARTR